MGKILLSISMLASNKIENIKRTLDSLQPIMEQIPSELILVDTSTDPEISSMLKNYTNHIITFKWINDFSAARNAGLMEAKGEWFLYIDDDEWFVEIDELIHFFKSGEYKKYGMANYIQRNFHDPEWLHYSDVWVSRMIRRDYDTRFCSKIHEYLYPARGKCKYLKLIANHTGYIAVTEEDRLKRYKRNSVLLLEMIEEEPMRLRWRVQLAQEYWAVEKWEELLIFCKENIAFTKNYRDKDDCVHIGTFFAGAMEALVNLKRYKEAEEVGNWALEDSRLNELCQAYIQLRFAVIAMAQEKWTEAKRYVNKYFLIREELISKEEIYANQKGALIVDETFESVSDKKAYSILIACGLAENKTDELKEYFEKLEWNQKIIYVYEDLIPVILNAMAIMPFEPIFEEAMQYLWKNKELQNSLCLQISAMEQEPDKFRNLQSLIAKVKGNHWYIWYHRNKENQWIENPRGISLAQWEEQIKDYVENVPLEELISRKDEMENTNEVKGVFGQVLEILLAQEIAYRKMRDSEKGNEDVSYFIKKFINQTIPFIEKYYTEEIKQNYSMLLPAYGQVAVELEKIEQSKGDNNGTDYINHINAGIKSKRYNSKSIRFLKTYHGADSQ